jgi:hypothetical protein
MKVTSETPREWNTFNCKNGAEYKWKHDDHCIAIKVGNNVIWLELEALKFFKREAGYSQEKPTPNKAIRYSIETRAEARKLYKDGKMTLREIGKKIGVNHPQKVFSLIMAKRV